MSEINFFGLERRHYEPLAKAPRPLVVPERHSTPRGVPQHNVAPRKAPAVVQHLHQPVDIPVKPEMIRPVIKPVIKPAVVKPAAVKPAAIKPVATKPTIAKSAPVKQPEVISQPTPAPKPHPAIIPIDDLLSDFIDNKPKVKKSTKAKEVRAKLTRKLAALKQTKVKKITPKLPKLPKLHGAGQSNFATQLQVAAANTSDAAMSTPTSMPSLNNGETAAVAESGNILDRLPRISLEIKINKERALAFIRAAIIISILAVSGYLAWDTWAVNRGQQVFSDSPVVASVAVDEASPSGVDMTSISNQAWAAHAAPADQARYVYLPSINAEARVMSAGINSKGKIDVPKNVNDAAWYDGSAKPGQEGQVLLSGSTSFASTYRSVFDNVSKLQIGDRITVELGDGKMVNYRIVSNETLAADKVDTKKSLDVPDGATRGLTLMICTGKFDYRTGSSDTRVIISAVQE
jgi:LPXTG-site transpeptidase (sortase) family protein